MQTFETLLLLEILLSNSSSVLQYSIERERQLSAVEMSISGFPWTNFYETFSPILGIQILDPAGEPV